MVTITFVIENKKQVILGFLEGLLIIKLVVLFYIVGKIRNYEIIISKRKEGDIEIYKHKSKIKI